MAENPFALLFTNTAALPERWRTLIATLRDVSPTNAEANGIQRALRDLEEAIAKDLRAHERLSPAQYAQLPHVRVSVQTVREWCRRGELPGAVLTDGGWEIPREATRAARRSA